MPQIKHTIEELNQFMMEVDGCGDGVQRAKDSGIYGMELDEAIPKLRELGFKEDVAWLKYIKKTEAYVRYNGKECTLGDYQIFNPISGQHEECATEEEAKLIIKRICGEILDHHKITVCRVLSNENGDSTWLPIEMPLSFEVVEK